MNYNEHLWLWGLIGLMIEVFTPLQHFCHYTTCRICNQKWQDLGSCTTTGGFEYYTIAKVEQDHWLAWWMQLFQTSLFISLKVQFIVDIIFSHYVRANRTGKVKVLDISGQAQTCDHPINVIVLMRD